MRKEAIFAYDRKVEIPVLDLTYAKKSEDGSTKCLTYFFYNLRLAGTLGRSWLPRNTGFF